MPAVSEKKRTVVVPEPQTREDLADDVVAGFEIVAGIDRANRSADVFMVVSASTAFKIFAGNCKGNGNFPAVASSTVYKARHRH